MTKHCYPVVFARLARLGAVILLLGGSVAAMPALAQTNGAMPGGVAADLEVRISELQSQMQDLTGKYEEALYANNQLRERLDKLQSDIDFRLSQMEAKVNGQGVAAAPAVNSGATADLGASSLPDDGTPLQSEKPAPPARGKEKSAAANSLPGGTVQQQYEAAFALLRQADYDKAEVALTQFIARNPKDALAANAQYWLGETYYVRQKFTEAAVAFADSYKKFPKGPKAPDSLLKLGMALAALNHKSDACTAYRQLTKDYPDVSASVKHRVESERTKLSCP
ncbi:MAG: tol-pal system protein YbgF [Azospirillaceae bacterium]|nr:tol-pal system protein YbgF [Azospirillaceae bacterium]